MPTTNTNGSSASKWNRVFYVPFHAREWVFVTLCQSCEDRATGPYASSRVYCGQTRDACQGLCALDIDVVRAKLATEMGTV